MLSNNERFEAGRILISLYRIIGESEFGYRVQGLFAHVILRIGGKVTAINAQGHPDVVGKLASHTLFVQVKAIHGRTNRKNFLLSSQDLKGITPANSSQIGYLAVLALVQPPSLILVNFDQLCKHKRPIHLLTLRAIADSELTQICTEELIKLVLNHKQNLQNLSYRVLCTRALKGASL